MGSSPVALSTLLGWNEPEGVANCPSDCSSAYTLWCLLFLKPGEGNYSVFEMLRPISSYFMTIVSSYYFIKWVQVFCKHQTVISHGK